MSAHRPTFEAAKGRAPSARGSQQVSLRHIPAQTKLKFRTPAADAPRRDLKRELQLAEWTATNRKRAKQGLDALPPPTTEAQGEAQGEEAEESRQSALALALELDQDSESEAEGSASNHDQNSEGEEEEEEEEEEESEEESEDEEAALLRELEKIKAERAAEAARRAASSAAADQLSRDDEIAAGNPLLNLQSAMASSSAGKAQDFGVQRRWDDDVIFKNQAAPRSSGSQGFVNDLSRSEFHKKFMNRYIK
ncbi:hypothetical protein PaG_03472 [Moesziomyces aphidis]|jgi:protein CWC15|uniref:Cwf15/Cwc15 cell cycle control protein n=1 Tax=Moesziomyces aphidis TaxID=84754 RepID=W3VLJ7_MOEAP|nr:hypothetical protein PaG_03472 [Moesziomyces aphidis]